MEEARLGRGVRLITATVEKRSEKEGDFRLLQLDMLIRNGKHVQIVTKVPTYLIVDAVYL